MREGGSKRPLPTMNLWSCSRGDRVPSVGHLSLFIEKATACALRSIALPYGRSRPLSVSVISMSCACCGGSPQRGNSLPAEKPKQCGMALCKRVAFTVCDPVDARKRLQLSQMVIGGVHRAPCESEARPANPRVLPLVSTLSGVAPSQRVRVRAAYARAA